MNTFHLDIITPTSINTFEDVSYIRAPGLDGLLGIQANHANAIIALGIGEIKIDINGKTLYFSTSGGYTDIQSKGVQLLLETIESSNDINQGRAQKSLDKAQKRIKNKAQDFDRAHRSLLRAKNRLSIMNNK